MLSVTHIINPVKVPESSDLFKAQPITFETMRRAKEFAKNDVDVTIVATCYEEDVKIIPSFFKKANNLDTSVLDYGNFKIKRKLPLLKDILQRAYDFNNNADYIIYTNVDIAVLPHFYQFIKQKIEEGLDAFVINRRTISSHYTLNTLFEAYSDYGEKHPGFDCFVFKRDLFEKFNLEKVCIGTTRVGLALISNLMINSFSFKIFKCEHLTFHIGEDRVWENDNLNDYVNFNENEAIKVLNYLNSNFPIKFKESELIVSYYEKLLLKLSNDNASVSKREEEKEQNVFKRFFKRK